MDDVETGIPSIRSGHMESTSATTENGSTGAVVVYVTVPSEEVGEKIAGMLVNPEARLAACVNIVPGIAEDSSSASDVRAVKETNHFVYAACVRAAATIL